MFNNPKDIADLLKPRLVGLDREHLISVMLNCRKKIIGIETIGIGTLTACLASPREIFKGAILAGADSIVLVHNHPSGEPDPSNEDLRLTERLIQAGKLIGIEVADHIVIAEAGFTSIRQVALEGRD
jgi:DNA repair protein RadC